MQQPDELIKLSDPGEVGRDEHTPADRVVVWFSNFFAWLFPILMIAICAQVVLRQMGNNQAWLDDLQWWLYGAAVLIGIAYAVTTNSHVRVDIFYDNYDARKKARTDRSASCSVTPTRRSTYGATACRSGKARSDSTARIKLFPKGSS